MLMAISWNLSSAGLAANVGWTIKGAVILAKKQKQCGGCWASYAYGSMEGARRIRRGQPRLLIGQQRVDCSVSTRGCSDCSKS